MLKGIDQRLSAEIERVIAPFAPQVELLRTIPGVDRRMAEALIAEIGVDMSRFGSSARLASWAGICPGQHESAGRQRRGTTRKGSKWLHQHLTQAAKAASRTKGTYLSAQYARLRGRRGGSRATIAVAHSILVAAFAMKLRTMAKVGGSRGSGGQLAGQLGLAPWQIDRARRDLQGWNEVGLGRAILAVAEADAQVKGAGRDPVYALETVVRVIAARGLAPPPA